MNIYLTLILLASILFNIGFALYFHCVCKDNKILCTPAMFNAVRWIQKCVQYTLLIGFVFFSMVFVIAALFILADEWVDFTVFGIVTMLLTTGFTMGLVSILYENFKKLVFEDVKRNVLDRFFIKYDFKEYKRMESKIKHNPFDYA